MQHLSIGEFAQRSRLSQKALRLYDELEVLVPAHVDARSGYRYYAAEQLDQARFVAALRELKMSLADIKSMLALAPNEAAQRISTYWKAAEAEHAEQRQLVEFLVRLLNGERTVMHEVQTRQVPSRMLLCLKRNVDGQAGAWALGKEFIAILRERPMPPMEGTQGAAFSIYWGEVSDDSDGPVEWCRPVPGAQAEVLAPQYPELTLRCESPHDEAFVHLGHGDQMSPAQLQLASESLRAWAKEHDAKPSDLGVRMTYFVASPVTEGSAPDCDFAVPLAFSSESS